MAAERQPLPDTRDAKTHKVKIETEQGYLSVYFIVGFDGEGRIREVFINAGKIGSTVRGLLNDFARLLSLGLQYGVPLTELCQKMTGSNYPPQGPTNHEAVPSCTSVIDYLFRWLQRLEEENRASRSETMPGDGEAPAP